MKNGLYRKMMNLAKESNVSFPQDNRTEEPAAASLKKLNITKLMNIRYLRSL